MNTYQIFTDAAADLPLDLYQRHGIQGVPMEYTLSGETNAILPGDPGIEEICDRFYDALRRGERTSTTQIAPSKYMEAFIPALEAGDDILYCCFSSGMSGTWQNSLLAGELLKERYPKRTIRCVDTLSSSAGQGLVALQAATLREQGRSLEETAQWLERHIQTVNHWFLVDDLDFLKQGGRVSPTVAFLGSKLQIKPILTIAPDGRLVIAEKVRGRRPAMKRLVQLLEARADFQDVPPVVLLDQAGCREDGALLAEMAQEVLPSGCQVLVTQLSPCVGAHTGPGMLSICFWGSCRR